MNHPLEWEIEYCLKQIDIMLDRTDAIELKLSCIPPTEELTLEDKWALRETLRGTRIQVNMLLENIKQLNENPPKKNFIKKLMRK